MGFLFQIPHLFGHSLGCDSKLSKMQDGNSVAGAATWRQRQDGGEDRVFLASPSLPVRVRSEKCPDSVP